MSRIDSFGLNTGTTELPKLESQSSNGWGRFGRALTSLGAELPVVGAFFRTKDASAGFDRQYELIALQQQIQEQSQIFNTITNISRAKHESAMSAIRNLK